MNWKQVSKPLQGLVSRHRRTIIAALWAAAKYEDSLEVAWRDADRMCAYKARRTAAKYRRLRQKLVSANEKLSD